MRTLRPAFALEDVDGAEFGRIKTPVNAGVPTFSLKQVRDFSVFRSKPVPDTVLGEVENQEI